MDEKVQIKQIPGQPVAAKYKNYYVIYSLEAREWEDEYWARTLKMDVNEYKLYMFEHCKAMVDIDVFPSSLAYGYSIFFETREDVEYAIKMLVPLAVAHKLSQ